MKIKNCICTLLPAMPSSLKERISILSTCELTNEEIKVFTTAFIIMEKAIQFDASIPRGIHANIIFTDKNNIDISIDEPETYGFSLPIITYLVDHWRSNSLSSSQILVIAMEELVHHFWSIRDEVEVKYKVFEILKPYFPKSSIEDFYSPNVLH